MAPVLYLKDITVAFGGQKLLDGAELSVELGDRVCLVGRNGSATVRNAKNYDSVFGKLTIFNVAKGKLEHVTDAQLGHACQGAVWTADGRRLLVQCSVERDIRTLDFDGKTLTAHPEMTIPFESRPGAIAVATK